MHIAIFSYAKPLTMHIANAAPVDSHDVAIPAYKQPVKQLFVFIFSLLSHLYLFEKQKNNIWLVCQTQHGH